MAELRQRLEDALANGIAEEPRGHAEQVARIAGVLYEAFSAVGLSCTVVGGSAVELHVPGVYTTKDIDLVIETVHGIHGDPRVRDVFTALGFRRKGMLWMHGDLAVHTPSSSLSGPDELVRVGDTAFRVLTKEAVLKDRVIAFKWWKSTGDGQQAIDMLAAFGGDVDLAWLRPQLESEDAWDAYLELRRAAESESAITLESLRQLLDSLHGKGTR